MRSALELERFVRDRATSIENEKLLSEGVAIYVRVKCFHILHANQKSIKWTWVEPFKMNAKVKLISNVIVDNESCFFFDA